MRSAGSLLQRAENRVTWRPGTFVDQLSLLCDGGNGGNGAVFFWKQAARQRRVPAGGSGGAGGSVKLRASPHVSCLRHLHVTQRANAGSNGSVKQKHGARGRDRVLDVPEGTIVWHRHTVDDVPHDRRWHALHDLRQQGDVATVATGGRGGRGNMALAARGAAPDASELGSPGERHRLVLEVSSIADVGFIGLPNAGKSSLLQRLTNAKPEANVYEFTTIRPFLGTMIVPDDEDALGLSTRKVTVCDLPGLLEGAHEGRGLGFNFLRHVKRCNALAAVVDLSAGLRGDERPRPWQQLNMLQHELEQYQSGLSSKIAAVIANKTDVANTSRAAAALERRVSTQVARVSAATDDGVQVLKQHLFQVANTFKQSTGTPSATLPNDVREQELFATM